MRKRIFTLLTALALLCLTACGGGGSGTSAEVQSAYAYMLTSARQVNDSIDAELYRYDYNGDGADDWIMFIVEDSCPVWMLLDGGSLDSSPTLLCDRQGGGAAVKLYTSSSEGKLFVEFLYSSSSIGSSATTALTESLPIAALIPSIAPEIMSTKSTAKSQLRLNMMLSSTGLNFMSFRTEAHSPRLLIWAQAIWIVCRRQ